MPSLPNQVGADSATFPIPASFLMLLQQWSKKLATSATTSITAASTSVPAAPAAAVAAAGDVRRRGTWLKTTPKHIWQLSRAGQGNGGSGQGAAVPPAGH